MEEVVDGNIHPGHKLSTLNSHLIGLPKVKTSLRLVLNL